MSTKISENSLELPWEVDRKAAKYQWAVSYLTPKTPLYIWKEPKRPDQVIKLYTFLRSSRNWVVCISASPSYVRTLYAYLEATWVINTLTTCEQAKPLRGIQDRDTDEEKAYVEAGLLIVPYFEPSFPSVQRAGSLFTSTVLMERNAHGRPTITDLYVTNRVSSENYSKVVKQLADTYGQLCLDLFTGEYSKCVLLRE